MLRAVVDVSVFADYYLIYRGKPERHERARRVLDTLSSLDASIYEPFLFEVELRAVLVRRISPDQALRIVDATLRHVNIIDEKSIHDKAAEIALLTGCRAIDAYYIASAWYVDAVVITSDKIMKNNSIRAGVNAYYLLDEKDYKILMNYFRA